jgi:RNA-directed DNA polymerase
MLGFIDRIELYSEGDISAPKGSAPLSANELIYQRFLIYTNFYSAAKPTIVCEGDTDNVYLTHAIRSLASQFPELAEINQGKTQLKVRLFKYPRTSTARILRLIDGGSGPLAQFIATYKRETDRFKATVGAHPFIILYDNDSGAGKIRSAIQQITKKPVSTTANFIHVIRNLYAVATPLTAGAAQSKIEDFFDATIKATKVNGKQFDDKNNSHETATHYGKKIFAHRVVRPNADTINFTGFHPLLTNIAAVISSYRARMSNAPPLQAPQTTSAAKP